MAILEDVEHGGHGGQLAPHGHRDDGATEGAAAGAAAAESDPNTPENKKKHREQMIAIGVAIIGVIMAWMIYRNKSSSSTTTPTYTTPAGQTGAVAGYGQTAGQSGADLNAYLNSFEAQLTANQAAMTAALNKQAQQQAAATSGLTGLLSSLQSEIGQMQAAPAKGSGGSGFPSLPAGYSGWQMVNGPGGQVLAVVGGYNANRQYSGFEVTGGAPVYAMNPGGSYQLGLPGSALQPGASFAVPTQYLRDVNTQSPVTNAPAF